MIASISTIDTKDAKEDFSELINRVSHNKERIVLTRRGKEVAALISLEDFALLQASQNKNDLAEAAEALKEARREGTLSFDDLKDEIG